MSYQEIESRVYRTMSGHTEMQRQLLNGRERPATTDEGAKVRSLCTETVRSLRSTMGECVRTEAALAQELELANAQQRSRIQKELDALSESKVRVEKSIRTIEQIKSDARRIQYELDDSSLPEVALPHETVEAPAPAGFAAPTPAPQPPGKSKVEYLIELSDRYARGDMTSEQFAEARERIANGDSIDDENSNVISIGIDVA